MPPGDCLANWGSLTSVHRLSNGVTLFGWLSDIARQPPCFGAPPFLRGNFAQPHIPYSFHSFEVARVPSPAAKPARHQLCGCTSFKVKLAVSSCLMWTN